MSRYSFSRVSGRANGVPCRPSTTWGPLTPRPRTNRSPDIAARVSAVIAVIGGTRALIWAMLVPSRIRLVWPARKASGVTASRPHASAFQQSLTPMRSASVTYWTRSGQARSRPDCAPPMPIPERILHSVPARRQRPASLRR